jgi:V/A-type H+-transporting ATPase subunit A
MMMKSKGKVTKAFGNLIHVAFEGHIRQGEVAMVHLKNESLKGEVIEILGNSAKMQVFEDTHGIAIGSDVTFSSSLLEAELGPGLLTAIYDGLQNPLNELAEVSGELLPRGIYPVALDRKKLWEFSPEVAVGAKVTRGDALGKTKEGRFDHKIMVPFSCYGTYTITYVASQGNYSVDTPIAKAIDQNGKEQIFTMMQKWPIKAPLCQGQKVKPSKLMDTGLRIIDTQFPIMKGGTFCTPGPFGAGKTMLQHHLAKYASVDIVVMVACGERAGEVVEVLKEFPHLIDPHTNRPLSERTVIICNTSSMPVAARESSVYMGMTIAEYYRQMGLDVLVLADSTSRWAQALREMSGRLEEIPGDEAFPAYLASRIAEFYERSGSIALSDGKEGSITLGGAVSPAGGNFEEPVTQATLAVVGAFLALSRERSDARRYPAIDPLVSWSKYVQEVGALLADRTEFWAEKINKAAAYLRQGNEIAKRMEVVGEEGVSLSDMVVYLKAELYDFSYLQQNAFDKEDRVFSLERQIALFDLINDILDTAFTFTNHDEARSFFLQLQNQIRNMNFLPFGSAEYKIAHGGMR